tara:strand:- start:1107 stop:1622 length:516 start_codon:yes stop_codon:yes gene_type:complete
MVKNFSTKLSGQIGENLVVAELGRRGIIATAFAGNVPEIDILAYKDKRSIPIQVKALKDGSLRTRADYYLNIHFDGKTQTVLGKREDINRDLTFIIVKVGERLGEDVFYICDQGIIQDLVLKGHSSFLKKHGGIRPRKPSSFDCSVDLKDLNGARDRWELIDRKLDSETEN